MNGIFDKKRMWGAMLGAWVALAGMAAYAQTTTLIAWGNESFPTLYPIPTNVMSNVTAIAAGGSIEAGEMHNLAVKDGTVVAWGGNGAGQCTVPPAASNSVSKVAAGGRFSVALKTDGQVLVWGGVAAITNVPVDLFSGASAIAAGESHVMALKNGRVYAWGDPNNTHYGQTNVPTEMLSGVTAISAGNRFSMALKDGQVYVWGGDDSRGNYGDGITNIPVAAQSGITAIAAGGYFALALDESGKVIHWGYTGNNCANLPEEAESGVDAIAAGYISGMILKDGAVYGWGGSSGNSPSNVPPAAKALVKTIALGIDNALAMGEYMAPRILTDSLPNAITGRVYSVQVDARGIPDVAFLQGTATAWPSWLTLNTTSGLLTGTPLEITNSCSIWIVASNTVGVSSSKYTFAVIARPPEAPVWVTPGLLPSGEVGLEYEVALEATEDPTYHLPANNFLPDGLTLSTDGVLSGTPTASVEGLQFYVVASNSIGRVTNLFTITIAPSSVSPPAIVTTSPLPDGKVGVPYSLQIEATNDPDVYTYSGTLPAGLELSTSGLLSGTPTTAETRSFIVTVTNRAGSAVRSFAVTIQPTYDPPVFVTTSPLPDAWVGDEYSQIILAANGIITYTIDSGSVPSGLSLSSGGLLSGTPTTSGAYTFMVKAANQDASTTNEYALTVNAYQEPEITKITPTNGAVVLEWLNPNTGKNVRVIMDKDVRKLLEPEATDMGVQTSPWTNTMSTNFMMYRLKLDR